MFGFVWCSESNLGWIHWMLTPSRPSRTRCGHYIPSIEPSIKHAHQIFGRNINEVTAHLDSTIAKSSYEVLKIFKPHFIVSLCTKYIGILAFLICWQELSKDNSPNHL